MHQCGLISFTAVTSEVNNNDRLGLAVHLRSALCDCKVWACLLSQVQWAPAVCMQVAAAAATISGFDIIAYSSDGCFVVFPNSTVNIIMESLLIDGCCADGECTPKPLTGH